MNCLPIDFFVNIKEQKHTDIILYPNPVNDEFYYDSELIISKIIIKNLNGITVCEINYPNNNISVSNLTYGIYFVEFHIGKEKIIKKILKI